MNLRNSLELRSFLDDHHQARSTMGGVDHVLTTRDTSQPHLDPRSLGVGIVIGMLSTLILVSLGYLLSTTYSKKHNPNNRQSAYSSKFHSSSRRHLVRSVVGTERITIDDGDEPAPISFSSSLGHGGRRYDHQRRTGLYENHNGGILMPTATLDIHRQHGTYDMQNFPSAEEDARSVIDIAPIPPTPAASKIETTRFPSGYWSSSAPSTSTTVQTHTELLPAISATSASSPTDDTPPVSSASRRRSSISKTHLSPRRAADGEQRGPSHAAMPSLGNSPPPPYANLSHVEEGADAVTQ